jgi:hypothetical protein
MHPKKSERLAVQNKKKYCWENYPDYGEELQNFHDINDYWQNKYASVFNEINCVYVVCMILYKAKLNEKNKLVEKQFVTIIKVGFSGERDEGTIFNRMKELAGEYYAIYIIPLLIMKANSRDNIYKTEKQIHKKLINHRLKIATTKSKYIGTRKEVWCTGHRELYQCDKSIIDIVYNFCNDKKYKLIHDEIGKLCTDNYIDNFIEDDDIKEIYGDYSELLFLEVGDSLTEKQCGVVKLF